MIITLAVIGALYFMVVLAMRLKEFNVQLRFTGNERPPKQLNKYPIGGSEVDSTYPERKFPRRRSV